MTLSALKKWAEAYIRSRDTLSRSIKGIESNGNALIVKRDEGIQMVIVSVLLDGSLFDEVLKFEEKVNVVCYNKMSNLKMLIEHWDKVKVKSNLSFIFVNPEGENDIKWQVFPNVHDKISDPQSLKPGLIAMFEAVGEFEGKL